MCGIIFNLTCESDVLQNALNHRGPDKYSVFTDDIVNMQFHRLKINDLSHEGDQPMSLNNCKLICNGEIFNHKELVTNFGFTTKSKSDCEVILHLYNHFKIVYKNRDQIIMDTLCNILDGEFAFCLYDIELSKVFYARDPYGVRPLFLNNITYSAASELKAFKPDHHVHVHQFPPGHFTILSKTNMNQCTFVKPILYTDILMNEENQRFINNHPYTDEKYEDILVSVKTLLERAVKKRTMSDRNVCALLSGGLDSSLVAALLSKTLDSKLKTFSIGFENSPDIKYANLVAKHIDSDHTNVIVSEDDFLNAIETVIHVIESYDTTTVRASVGNYLISKYISENSDCVVVFNGDYADEVCGGYKYVKKCPDELSFQHDCINRVRDIHFFDSLRSDRSISSNGLEARVPFADKIFLQYYMSIPHNYRMSNDEKIEKKIIRDAFANDGILPDEVLWRPKEAFSDGVSAKTNSWGDIVRQFIDQKVTDEDFTANNYMNFKLKETYYYHKIFSKYYKNDKIIPYLWMPRFCDPNIADPSARKL